MKKIKKVVEGKTVDKKDIQARIKLIEETITKNKQVLQSKQNEIKQIEGLINAQLGALSELSLLIEPSKKAKKVLKNGAPNKT